jgi:hypothetical protein
VRRADAVAGATADLLVLDRPPATLGERVDEHVALPRALPSMPIPILLLASTSMNAAHVDCEP